jgi:hypothetical protein
MTATYESPLANRFTHIAQLSRFGFLGFLGFLGCLGFIPGYERLLGLSGLSGFFGLFGFAGFFGLARYVECLHRRKANPAEPRRRPEFGLEAVVRRALGEPAQGDLLLGGGELAGPPRDRPGNEAGVPSVAEGGQPAPHRSGINLKEVGDLLGREPLGDSLDREAPSVLQLVC